MFSSPGCCPECFRPLFLCGHQTVGIFQLTLLRLLLGLFFRLVFCMALLQKIHGILKTREIALSPYLVGMAFFFPCNGNFEIRVSVEPCFSLEKQLCRLCKSSINFCGLGFIFNPFSQSKPYAHQTFMRNVNHGRRGYHRVFTRH